MFRNLWGKSNDRSAEPDVSPVQKTADYEAIFFALLDEVERRSEFNRG
jgi:hypothetical protein